MTAPARPGNPWAHMPFVPSEGRYRLGAALTEGASDFWWNTQQDDGTYTSCDLPEGWEGLEYITPLDQVGGRDGALTGPPSIAPRELPISGLIVAPDARSLALRARALRSLLSLGSVVWDQFDHGLGYRMGMVCVPSGRLAIQPVPGHVLGNEAATVAFTLYAGRPEKYATGPAEFLVLTLPSGTISGRTYSKTYSFTYGAATNPGGEGTAINRGDRPAWPVFSITGPVDQPTITNETTGRAFTLAVNVPAGVTYRINSLTGVTTPFATMVGRPFSLAPGGNTIRWRGITGTFDPAASLRLDWRSTSS